VSTARVDPAARLRGVAVGALTALLAVTAHGGGVPGGAGLVLLLMVAALIGALAVHLPRAADTRVLLILLSGGQLLGHLVLAETHQHVSRPTGPFMLAAHAAAVLAGAVLIAAGGRLWSALSRAVARIAPRRPLLITPRAAVRVRRADQPRHSQRQLAASVSHRGPPVSLAR
jgi:hypothetical protein